ncbi:S24/S26 family peptidase [Bacteroides caecigallinarum]|uniref:S24/S26 family peptidase n=1 Tax=Bacteroides caecigallinarum TaxID=1411144 RepID=UPI001956B0E2|nr:S24/S26 family peptidase [Bacteroides caecigallinarum]MBM6882838.1 S24/S26 family peptidase [Bacteroides caecigallinarum]MBM6889861.1 S24/S26 family peptidase [Bacteroides caecigallinarum]MCF2551427.1 S24/S26 family peptidase [Bacteroides caecigallinarum]
MKKLVMPNEIILGEVERLLSQGTMVTINTKGCSMLPFIVGERDSVVLKSYGEPRIGDIALAHLDNGVYVLHRIINISDDGFVTLMGDGNIRGTENCHISRLCGKAVTVVRKGKRCNPDSGSWRLMYIVWRKLLPVRRYLLAIYRRLLIKII